MDSLIILKAKSARGVCHLPGSKSISNRVLLLASLCEKPTILRSLLNADDVRFMRDALSRLGVGVESLGGDDWRIIGNDGRFKEKSAKLFLGNAGTAVRPLTAVLAVLGGNYEIDGVMRMRERPITDLIDALRMLGCHIDYCDKSGFLPLRIEPRNLSIFPEKVTVRGDVSSQFLSALLMALPLLPKDEKMFTEVELSTPLISRPYVEITMHLMARFGVIVEMSNADRFRVPRGITYRSPDEIIVESDASSASYFIAAGVLGGGPIRICGVGRDSIQGDIAFAEFLRQQGANILLADNYIDARIGKPFVGGEINCIAIPDAAMTLAMTALKAQTPTTLTHIGSWRVKETDRISAMSTELRKTGARVESGADWLKIFPAETLRHAKIDTYDDHRMAMCFSLLALLDTDVTINDPKTVSKTFPGYFDEYKKLLRY
ncbi:MAG: 3-phosphoshikimate 1-carboxyvinyltransferase [Burkholderiales bacterium]|jgi:3-phosphoshikimate 1-carboxyvinyltransferase|nr:3-phosphoshikimate 1-carboxyvinyltransferase [Burkholderiales bacterium]